MIFSLNILVISLILIDVFSAAYVIPALKVELTPKGFQVSIPAEDDIRLFAFHGSINTPLNSIEEGDFNGEVTEPTNGKFVYVNNRNSLEPGDILYFWVHVQKGNLGYKKVLQASRILPSGIPSENYTVGSEPVNAPKPPNKPSTTLIFPTSSVTSGSSIPSDANLCSKGVSSHTRYNGNIQPCKGDLIFEESFSKLNNSIWQSVIQIPSDNYDSDFVSFQGRRENVYVSAGNLHIVPSLLTDLPGYRTVQRGQINLKKDCTPTSDYEKECYRQASGYSILPPIVSAKIRTKDSFSFKYGRVVVKAKLPKGDWIFPLITLEPTAFSYGVNFYSSGQIRIAYIRGNVKLVADNEDIGGSVLYGGPILDLGNEKRTLLRSKASSEHYGDQFYNFELLWTPKFLRFFVNDEQFGEIKTNHLANTGIKHSPLWASGDELAPFDKEFHLSLGLSVGGQSDFPDNCLNGVSKRRKPWENDDPKAEFNFWKKKDDWHRTWDGVNSGLIVDSVRVYALND